MSKNNDLHDYLLDLYEGISAKIPDASRNPQDFRSAIDSLYAELPTLFAPVVRKNGDQISWAANPKNGEFGATMTAFMGGVEQTPPLTITKDNFGKTLILKVTAPNFNGSESEVSVCYAYEFKAAENIIAGLNEETGELLLAGSGRLPDLYSSSGAPWEEYEQYIKSAWLSDGITHIGTWTFYGCRKLTSITIPDSVTRIGQGAFCYCGFTNITIPDSVTSIGDYAFGRCESLESIKIPTNLTSIPGRLCEYCYNLTSVEIPDSVTSIGYTAFDGCKSLVNIVIPSTVTSIGHNAFRRCDSLIQIENDIQYVGEWLVGSGESVISPVLRENTVGIADQVFQYRTNLTSIVIPDSVRYVGGNVFSSCTSLTGATIGNSVVSIGDRVFANCTALTNITIPDSVTNMGIRTFNFCTNLTSATIGNGLARINDYTFDGCTNLTSVTVGNGVTSIGEVAFRDCSSLTSITLPNSVTSIHSSAFGNCSNLKDIYVSWGLGKVPNAPWGATNATIHYNNEV